MLIFLLPDYPITIQQITIAYTDVRRKQKLIECENFQLSSKKIKCNEAYKNHNKHTLASRFNSAQQSSATIEK